MNNLHKIQTFDPEQLTAEQLWLIYNQWYYGTTTTKYSAVEWWHASDSRIVRDWIKQGRIKLSDLIVLNRMQDE